jgi:phage-related protein
MMLKLASLKPLEWAPGALRVVRSFPKAVRIGIGRALQFAQAGSKHPAAKAMKGFSGASVIEIIEDYDRATYRAVYTVRFEDCVYVLHAFQKKSKRGIATPQTEIDLIRTRLKWAEQLPASRKNS